MLNDNGSDDNRGYTVVVNDEGQYSIWLADQEIPAGWRMAGHSGTRTQCLSHIDKVWTDMTPLSARAAPPTDTAHG